MVSYVDFSKEKPHVLWNPKPEPLFSGSQAGSCWLCRSRNASCPEPDDGRQTGRNPTSMGISVRKSSILVGGLEHEFYEFPYIGNVIIPTDKLHHFSEG